jgi:hypothetical protein
MDATKLRNRITELENRISEVRLEVNSLKQKYSETLNISKNRFDREELMTRVLRNVYRCEHAIEVGGVDECWGFLPVRISKLDGLGRPIECVVSFGGSLEEFLRIRPGQHHFSTGFRPEALAWLPSSLESGVKNVEP